MAKKAPVKKTRRLKRSVRRSLAAVLMVTSIAVAAIPVPENYAEGEGESPDTPSTPGITDQHDMSEYGFKETGLVDDSGNKDTKYDEKQDPKNKVTLDEWEDATTEELIKNLYKYDPATGKGSGTVYPSLKLNMLGNKYNLTWEFMYYLQNDPRSGTDKGVVCKYNNENSATEVTLKETPVTGYYTVEEQTFDDFYSGDLWDSDPTAMMLDPTEPLKYTYTMYKNSNGELDRLGDENVKIFYRDYANGQYTSKVADFKKYDEEVAKLNPGDSDDHLQYLKEDLAIIPSNFLDSTQRLKFFCDFDAALNPEGEGYHLESVYDNRVKVKDPNDTSSGNSEFVYIAKDGTPKTGGRWSNDSNGFLTTSVGVQMFAIGNKAFAGVGNVKELTLPQDISHIGDEAFEGASLIEKISLSNVEHIGNRAFKNCDKLSKVEIISGTKVIGAECFAKSAVTEVTLPNAVNTIGYGAFADCRRLVKLNLNGISQPCKIKDYAFYNCSALAEILMKDSKVVSMGKGVFAVSGGAVPLSVEMPREMGEYEDDCIGDYLFSGRSGLKSVVFPQQFGSSPAISAVLPPAMFHGCTNLEYVEFPADNISFPHAGAHAEYDPKLLFADVNNTNLYVRGPETKDGAVTAKPRECTWEAISRINNFVPYVFKNSAGVDCYEVAIGGYRYQANAAGELTSCVLVGKTTGDLVIPSKVGNYPIKSIVPGCFADEKLRESIVTLTIEDDSITSVGDSVFKDLPNLEKATIGNSVASIGNSAFEGCDRLIDVTFHSPNGGHNNFTVGTNAFKTGGKELTFHGDIVKGYAPFTWAMDKDNLIDSLTGMRVCYKSLAPTYQTVMYDAGTGYVTLLDYPKYDQVDDILNETHREEWEKEGFASYGEMMEAVNYEIFKAETYNPMRESFKTNWNNAGNDDEAREAVYNSEFYGPWINPEFCDEIAKGGSTVNPGTSSDSSTTDPGNSSGPSTSTPDDTTWNNLADFLFEPLVVQAAGARPLAFYEEDTTHKNKKYSVLRNAESDNIYRALTAEESALVNATKNVVVPVGVDSVDVNGFMTGVDANKINASKYLSISKIGNKSHSMYTSIAGDADDETKVQPGLFSGYYDDKYTTVENELYKRGNDRVETVTLGSVKYLPDYAFDSCERLRLVELGPDCADIGTAPFRGCYNMTVVGDNQYYKTQNGIVYSVNTDGSYTIEECLAARGRAVGTAVIPDSEDSNISSVSAIKPGAFEDCDYINTVDLSKAFGLTVIPRDCFKNDPTTATCGQLSLVSLPRSVNEIQAGAFANVLNLRELTIPGMEVFISASAFEDNDDKNNPKAVTNVRTFQDSSARRYVSTYGATEKYNLQWADIGDQWRVTFYDADGVILTDLKNQDGEPIENPQYVENDQYVKLPTDPVKEGWTFDGWLGTDNTKVSDRIHGDTNFIAQGHNNNGSVGGRYVVEFYDGMDGKMLAGRGAEKDGKYYVDTDKSFEDMGFEAPTFPAHENAANPRWSENWTTATKVTSNLTIVALYSATTSGGGTNTSGNTTNTSGNTTNNNNTSSKSTSTTSTSSSTSSTSTSTSSTTSDGRTTAMYTLLVQNGSGSGSYEQGASVIISAYPAAEGMVFSNWTTESNGVTLMPGNSSPVATFTMPGNNVSITANYVPGTAAGTSTPVGTTGTTTTPDGNTTVDITKPGISNKDLATANVNGSTDNFIVKISETDLATQAVAAALTNKYGNLENILYYAMDITLWDSTGTYQLTGDQVAGLSVDITIPIPDALVAYGGNNMAGAVVNGDQLENLNESFTTINGVPCIRFQATHFSPYTIYVDTGNLTEGMLDVTPKTGDPIHPKWFLSIGLACLSIALFMKRDKKTKIKTA